MIRVWNTPLQIIVEYWNFGDLFLRTYAFILSSHTSSSGMRRAPFTLKSKMAAPIFKLITSEPLNDVKCHIYSSHMIKIMLLVPENDTIRYMSHFDWFTQRHEATIIRKHKNSCKIVNLHPILTKVMSKYMFSGSIYLKKW